MTCSEFRRWLDGYDITHRGNTVCPTPTVELLTALAVHVWQCSECAQCHKAAVRREKLHPSPMSDLSYRSGFEFGKAAVRTALAKRAA